MKMRGALSLLLADLDHIRREKTSVTGDHRAPLGAAQPALDAGARSGGDRVGTGLYPGHVHAGRRVEDDAVIGGAAGDMSGIGAGDQGLGRRAAGVDASAAEQVALDHRHRHAGPGEPDGKRGSSLTCADDDRIEASAHQIIPSQGST